MFTTLQVVHPKGGGIKTTNREGKGWRAGRLMWRILRTVFLSVCSAVFFVTAGWLILVILGFVGDIADRFEVLLVQFRFWWLGLAFVCSVPFFWLRWK